MKFNPVWGKMDEDDIVQFNARRIDRVLITKTFKENNQIGQRDIIRCMPVVSIQNKHTVLINGDMIIENNWIAHKWAEFPILRSDIGYAYRCLVEYCGDIEIIANEADCDEEYQGFILDYMKPYGLEAVRTML